MNTRFHEALPIAILSAVPGLIWEMSQNNRLGGNEMRRLTMMVGALGAALLMSTGAFAQVPPDPNNPNEPSPIR